jgi:hypothetical protein
MRREEVLELLSTKSLDSPPKSVVNVSSRPWLLFVPWLQFHHWCFAWARPAETVAAIKRLLWYSCGGFALRYYNISICIKSPLLFFDIHGSQIYKVCTVFWSNWPMTWYCFPFFHEIAQTAVAQWKLGSGQYRLPDLNFLLSHDRW